MTPRPPEEPATPSGPRAGLYPSRRQHKHQQHQHHHHHHHPLVMNKVTVYETKTRLYIVGSSQSDSRYRVLKVDRTTPAELSIVEDDVTYTHQETVELLAMIDDGNKSSGGLKKVTSAYGIIGFVRFMEGYYVSLIAKRSAVALIGGHYVYHIDDTILLPICPPGKNNPEHPDESRYVGIFQSVDLTKNFYFSYTYDITNTLQHNILVAGRDLERRGAAALPAAERFPKNAKYNDMFVWNYNLLQNGFGTLGKSDSDWVLPVIHGFVDQAKISVFGRSIFVTLIARRSRLFAGARFLKRGANDQGFVANDVESEQIVNEMSTTPFFRPMRASDGTCSYLINPRFTSFVQHRGSIPLFWSQDTANMAPKPPIELNVRDPFFATAALHFDNMFKRYGGPIIVLNLVKQKEKTKRESLLLEEFTQCVEYLNQFLPPGKAIKYIAWDMSRASKSRDQDVIRILEEISEDSVASTGFYHSGGEPHINALRRKWNVQDSRVVQRTRPTLQSGVVRTNCIDCLDRTNAAQFIIGKCALGHQLYALGIIDNPHISFDSDAATLLTEMYHDHGDTIALQYGGSHLVNTMETYRKLSGWTSHSRDVVESIRRYYSNSFVDAEKQDAINLFLGNFEPSKATTPLWELTTDYYLHHADPRFKWPRRSYIDWWTKDAFITNNQNPCAVVVNSWACPSPNILQMQGHPGAARLKAECSGDVSEDANAPATPAGADEPGAGAREGRAGNLLESAEDAARSTEAGLPYNMKVSERDRADEDGNRLIPSLTVENGRTAQGAADLAAEDTFWDEYYRPRLFSSFQRLFAFNMMSTMRMVKEDHYDYSPFSVRRGRAPVPGPPVRLDVGGIRSWLSLGPSPTGAVACMSTGQQKSNPPPLSSDSESCTDDDLSEPSAPTVNAGGASFLSTGPQTGSTVGNVGGSIPPAPPPPAVLKENSTETVIKRLTAPTVTQAEAKEYRRYINQFRTVQLWAASKSHHTSPHRRRGPHRLHSVHSPPLDTGSPDAERAHPEYATYMAYVLRGSAGPSRQAAAAAAAPAPAPGPRSAATPHSRTSQRGESAAESFAPPGSSAPGAAYKRRRLFGGGRGPAAQPGSLRVREVDERVYAAYASFPNRVMKELLPAATVPAAGRYEEYAKWLQVR